MEQSRVTILLREASDCCTILLLLKPVGRVPPALKSVGHTHRGASPEAYRRWHKAVTVIRAIIRWRTVVSGRKRKEVIAAVARFVRAMLEMRVCPEKLQRFGEGECSGDASMPCLLVLFVLVLHNYQRAATRTSGFRAFHTLAVAVRTPSLLADVLLSLPPALSTPQLVERHHLTHLSAVSDSTVGHVSAAFRALQTELLDVLGEFCGSVEGGIAATCPSSGGGAKVKAQALEQTKKCRTTDTRCFDARTILILLEVWGLTIHPEDWRFMESAGVLRIVSLAATQFAEHDLSESEVNGGIDTDGYGDAALDAGLGVRKDRSSRPLAVVSKEGSRAYAACHAAAWVLFRTLTIQLHGFELNWYSRGYCPRDGFCLASITDVLHTELRKCVLKTKSNAAEVGRPGANRGRQHRDRTPSQTILEFASPGIGGVSESPPRARIAGGNRAPEASTLHKRRCQELVGSPRRLMNMEDGLVFPAEQVLNNPRGSDFSITFWLLLGQDRTGHHRTVLARGHRSERWPVLLLRDSDNRLEVRNTLL